jgi:hypothetical protein
LDEQNAKRDQINPVGKIFHTHDPDAKLMVSRRLIDATIRLSHGPPGAADSDQRSREPGHCDNLAFSAFPKRAILGGPNGIF